jgi:hypothetical protein
MSRLPPRAMSRQAIERLAERAYAMFEALRSEPSHAVTGAVCRPTQDRTKAVWNWLRMGRALLASTGPFEPGECRVCGCTETTACNRTCRGDGIGACSWIEGSGETLCSNPDCVEAAIGAGKISQLEPARMNPPAWLDEVVDRARRAADNAPAALRGVRVRHSRTLGERTGDVYVEGADIDRITGTEARFAIFDEPVADEDCYGAGCDEFPGLSRQREPR